ncbi:MAG: hypothetical protein ACE5ER_11920, partial [Nitrospinaceae bacterium]
MLIFKKNIYFVDYAYSGKNPFRIEMRDDDGPQPIAYNFIFSALASIRRLFIEFKKMDPVLAQERVRTFYPNASRFGNTSILNTLSKRLMRGLLNNHVWHQMNCYHFCMLYDGLMDLVEEYSYGDGNFRENLIPEMKGQPINFNQFLNEYFFHTAFLIDPKRFQRLQPGERRRLGYGDTGPFGILSPRDAPPATED